MSDPIFQLMLTTWMTDPGERPDFGDILQTLSEIMSTFQVRNKKILFIIILKGV